MLVVEQELGQRARQLGLAHAGRPQEQERAQRPVGILQPGPRAPHRVGHRTHRLILADHALLQPLLHLDQLLDLALQQLGDRHAAPFRDHLGDILLVDLLLEQRAAAGLELRLGLAKLFLQPSQRAIL